MAALVVPVCGAHGVGKTTLVRELARRGLAVLDEGFLRPGPPPAGSPVLPPQCTAAEAAWMGRWLERVVAAARPGGVLVTDRSALAAAAYAEGNGRALLLPVALQAFEDLRAAGVAVRPVLLRADADGVMPRLQERAAADPQREALREGSREHLEDVAGFYSSLDVDWALQLDNDAPQDIAKLADAVEGMISSSF